MIDIYNKGHRIFGHVSSRTRLEAIYKFLVEEGGVPAEHIVILHGDNYKEVTFKKE